MIIFHTGDVHLDAPFSGLDVRTAENRRRELRDTFERMMNYAADIKADLVLIPGDLFDDGYATRETIAFLIKCFRNLPCKVVISPGNHDPYTAQSIWAKKLMPSNVYVFDSSELSHFDFEDINCTVWGWAFTKRNMTVCPIGDESVGDSERINILSVHADVASPISSYCPLSKNTILAFGADFTALAHIHTPEAYNEQILPFASYCGCPEGRDFSELGIKGANVIKITKELGEIKRDVSFVRFSKKTYEIEEVDCSGCTDFSAVTDAVKSVVDNRYNDATLLRVVLTGNVSPSLVIDRDALASKIVGPCFCEVIDNTAPLIDAEFYLNDKGIRGEVYRTLLPKLESADPAERETARMAFRITIAALNGENITDK